ncbi:hypothetical protein EC991_008329 [Linnemannia zychae]|nr:hypothetical protein EC991_008329 [Linnemannia zychae]
MDDHLTDRRKHEYGKPVQHGGHFAESCQNSDTNNSLRNKRRRINAVDCDKFLDMDEVPGAVDVLTSRRMRILLREKPWHNYVDFEAAPEVLSTRDRQELLEFKEQQQSIQLQMADEALCHWKKLIDFIGAKVIPQENAVLRQLAQSNLIPISGVESLLLPLLRQLHREEEKSSAKMTSQLNHSQTPLVVSIRTRAHTSPKAARIKPPDRCSPLYNDRNVGYVTIIDQAVTETGTETEDDDDEVSPWTSVWPVREQSPDTELSPSAVLDDVSCLENSLEIVSTITAEVESFHKSAHMPTIDFAESNPYLLTESFFSRLRKDQAKAERLGLSGVLYSSLLIDVLREHVQLVQTLSIQMSNRVISLMPISLVKNPASFKDSSASSSMGPNLPHQESFPNSMLSSGVSFEERDQEHSTESQGSEIPGVAPLATDSVSKSKAGDHIDEVKADDSVRLVWQRWRFGEDGMESLQELINRQGMDKMALALRTYCTIAYYVSNEIERLCGNGMDVDNAIESLESRRHLSLPALAMVICQEEERRKGEDRAISGSTKQSSILTQSDVKALSANVSRSAIDTATVSDRSEAAQTLSARKAFLVALENPVLGLSNIGQSPSSLLQIPSTFGSRPNNVRASFSQQSSKMVTSVATSAPTNSLSKLPEILSSEPETVSPVGSTLGLLRSTFEALAAMNTTKSALGAAFTGLQYSTQLSAGLQGAQDPLYLPGPLPVAIAGLTQSSVAVPSHTGPTLTTAPATPIETVDSTTHQSIAPLSLKLSSIQSASDLHAQAMFSPPMLCGSPSKVSQSFSALAAPTTRPLAAIPQQRCLNNSTSTTKSPQLSSVHIPVQSRALQQQQHQSALISQASTSSTQVHSTPTAESSNKYLTSRAVTSGSGPEPSTLAASQGVLQLLDATALRGAVPVASATPATSVITLATTTATTAATSALQTPVKVPLPHLLQQIKGIGASRATLMAVPQRAPGVAVSSPSTASSVWGKSLVDGLEEQAKLYRINLELETVFEIWDLWTMGIHGSPSVTDLIGKHKMEWLHHTDREIYRDYRSVLLTLERIVRLLKIDVRVGLARLEKIRVDFKMSVRQFAQVLTELDAGKVPIDSTLTSLMSNQYPETTQDFAAAIASLTLP